MTSMFKRSENAIFADVGDDVVALHIPKGHCYGMEKVTAAVWKLLAEPIALDEICEQLVQHYEVGPDQCREEIGALIEQFRREGLVEEVAA